MHGLIYSQLIGDVDSSVLKRLRIAKPYGSDIMIKKIESIRFRKNETGIISYEEKLARLKTDVINGPNHVFRDHDNCSKYFCQGKKKDEQNHVLDLKRLGLWDDICRRRRRRLFSTPTNRSTKNTSAGPDEEYGNVVNDHDPLSNLTDTEYSQLETAFLNKLKLTENEIWSLEDRTKRQHQCDEWHLERKKRLTASYFGKLCKLRESTSRVNIVNEMLFGTFKGNAATRYGIEHEMIAIEQLENKINKKIVPSGLIVDLNQPFLAASPDGLIGSDSLVEIKCPASAKDMTPEEGINRFLFEKIKRDDSFWNDKMATQLTTFYMDFLLKQLIKDEY
ncbi:unnamed protein product [Macrosiphum euphorbiae]|uniref:YqaJ viral recombinase domain-containing protein n=1 Tax=Macrosiphum euphorbiae TaxID=13131 RepID=A0AAV0WVE8_9HEMI|nr:unnamed protein product [Macrosiphum euphorbiae]